MAGGLQPGGVVVDVRRKNASRESTSTLKAWLYEHRKNPYPTKAEKIMLAIITKMTLTQVSTWFANARRRLKKENKNGEWGLKDSHDDDDSEDVSESSHTEPRSRQRSGSVEDTVSNGSCLTSQLVLSDAGGADTAAVSSTTTTKRKLWSVDDMVSTSTKTDNLPETALNNETYDRHSYKVSAAAAVAAAAASLTRFQQ